MCASLTDRAHLRGTSPEPTKILLLDTEHKVRMYSSSFSGALVTTASVLMLRYKLNSAPLSSLPPLSPSLPLLSLPLFLSLSVVVLGAREEGDSPLHLTRPCQIQWLVFSSHHHMHITTCTPPHAHHMHITPHVSIHYDDCVVIPTVFLYI